MEEDKLKIWCYQCIQMWNGLMFQSARSLLANEEDVIDAVGEVKRRFLQRCYKGGLEDRGHNRMGAYIQQVMINHCYDVLGRPVPEPLPDNDLLKNDTQDPTQIALTKIELERCLNQLNPELRDIVVMHIGDCVTCADIARRLNLKEVTVRQRVYKALHQIRRWLEEQGGCDE